jgi:hypothetical protein
MPLQGVFVSGDDAYRTSALSGNLDVLSTIFVVGELVIWIGDEYVRTQIVPDGTAKEAMIKGPLGQPKTLGTATLTRLSPVP